MPIEIPNGEYVNPVSDVDLLSGSRHVEFKFFWVKKYWGGEEGVVEEALGIVPGGSLDWDANASVKGSGRITIQDVGQEVDWLNWRLKITAIITGPNGDSVEEPLGVWIPTAPVERREGNRIVRDVELLDKSTIIDQGILGNEWTGKPFTYTVPAGRNVLDEVRQIIQDGGEFSGAIGTGPEALMSPMTFKIGTSRLKAVNELLDAAGYFSVWVDGNGYFRASKYRAPRDRSPILVDLGAFTDDSRKGLMDPSWSRDIDVWAIPNRVVAIQQSQGEVEGLVGLAVNQDPESPYSQPSRGRWVTAVYDQVEAVDQASLDSYASLRLSARQSLAEKIEVSHLPVPGLRVNSVVEFDAASVKGRYSVQKTSWPLSYNGLAKTTLNSVFAEEVGSDPLSDLQGE